jgi:hypothetical protein
VITAEEYRQAVTTALNDPDGMLATLVQEVRYLRQADAGGRGFTDIATGIVGAAGAAVVPMDGPPVGQVWELERVSVSIGGASAAAQLALYLDAPADDVNLLDYANAMLGNAPSRYIFGAPSAAYLIPPATPVILSVAGAVVGSNIAVRYQGRRLEVATSGGKV